MNPLVEALLRRKAQQVPVAEPAPAIDPLQQAATAQAPAPNPFVLNPQLEAQAAPMNNPVHPMVMAIARHLGLMNMIRNKQNEKMTTLQDIDQQ